MILFLAINQNFLPQTPEGALTMHLSIKVPPGGFRGVTRECGQNLYDNGYINEQD